MSWVGTSQFDFVFIVLLPDTPAEDTSSSQSNPRKTKSRTEDTGVPNAKRIDETDMDMDTQTGEYFSASQFKSVKNWTSVIYNMLSTS